MVIKQIITNASKSLYTDINGKENRWNFSYIFIMFLAPLISITLVYYTRNNFMKDPKVIATLLSLFSGLMFGVLIKIPDKFKDLDIMPNDSIEIKTRKLQVKNYLKLFMYSLSFSIIVALIAIIGTLLNAFFPTLMEMKFNDVEFSTISIDWKLTFTTCLIILFRLILVTALIHFLFFIFKAISNLYEFMLYEFSKIK